MNSRILSSVSGGSKYDTIYPADFSQVSTLALALGAGPLLVDMAAAVLPNFGDFEN